MKYVEVRLLTAIKYWWASLHNQDSQFLLEYKSEGYEVVAISTLLITFGILFVTYIVRDTDSLKVRKLKTWIEEYFIQLLFYKFNTKFLNFILLT